MKLTVLIENIYNLCKAEKFSDGAVETEQVSERTH